MENLLTQLFAIVQNSAKIISSSGVVALRFVFRYVHTARLLPHLCQALNSKSCMIRRSLTEVLELALASWPTHSLEKHLSALRDSVRKGVGDADQETRALSRRAFLNFERHFPDQADAVLQSLDPSKRKMLEKERNNVDFGGGSMAAPNRTTATTSTRPQPVRRAITQEELPDVTAGGLPRSTSDHQALRQTTASAAPAVPVSSTAARRPYTTTAAHQQLQQQRQQSALQTWTAHSATAAEPRKGRTPVRRPGGVSQSQRELIVQCTAVIYGTCCLCEH